MPTVHYAAGGRAWCGATGHIVMVLTVEKFLAATPKCRRCLLAFNLASDRRRKRDSERMDAVLRRDPAVLLSRACTALELSTTPDHWTHGEVRRYDAGCVRAVELMREARRALLQPKGMARETAGAAGPDAKDRRP